MKLLMEMVWLVSDVWSSILYFLQVLKILKYYKLDTEIETEKKNHSNPIKWTRFGEFHDRSHV